MNIQLQTKNPGSPTTKHASKYNATTAVGHAEQALDLDQGRGESRRETLMRPTDEFVFFDKATELSTWNEFTPLPQDELRTRRKEMIKKVLRSATCFGQVLACVEVFIKN